MIMNEVDKRKKIPRKLKKKLDKRLKYCAEGFFFYYDEDRILPAGQWLNKYRDIYDKLYDRYLYRILFPKRNL